MNPLNWMTKLDATFGLIKESATAHWEIAATVAVIASALALLVAIKNPDKSDALRKKARILRYCHNCQFSDLFTETCSINADQEEKCGLIDQTAGFEWTIPEKVL